MVINFNNELIFLTEKYGIKSIIFVDDNIVMAKTDCVGVNIAVPLNKTKMRDIAVEVGVLPDKNNINVDWRYAQIVSDEWTSRDISILRAYEWDRINFSSPERRKRTAELWGIDEPGMEKIRKETRDTLTFESISAQI